MATYIQIHDMRADANFRKQVAVACWKTAAYIMTEAGSATNHKSRLRWAEDILSSAGSSLIERMATAAAQNATLQATAPAGPWVDNDIQYVVDASVDEQATSAF